MQIAPHPDNERERIRAIQRLNILDTDPENVFDDLTKLAAHICDTPISLMSFVDSDRQWFKSHYGLTVEQTERDISFCSHTILGDDLLEVRDTSQDDRFHDNPFVTGESQVKFYAGFPLKTSEGLGLGSLCVIDHRPRQLSAHQIEALKIIGRQIVHLLELRQKLRGTELMEEMALNAQALSKKLSRNLRQEHNQLLSHLEKAPVGISIVTGPDYTYEVVNQEYRRFCGQASELAGQKYFDLFPHLRGTEMEKIMHQVYHKGESFSATDYEVTIPGNEKNPCYFDFQMQPFQGANQRGILTVAIDTTKKNQALNALRESVEKFRLFAETAPHMAFIADASGNIIYFNQRWYDYIGNLPEDEGWGWQKKNVHHPDDLSRTIEAWNDSMATGKPYEIEYRLRRHDGVYRWHLGRALPIRNSRGEITRWFGNNVDIHDQKELTEQLMAAKNAADEANMAKSSFLANMSHEIRTPLGAIMGFAEQLAQPEISKEQFQKYISVISRNSTYLQRIIDDILDLSKVEAGKMIIEHIECSVKELISEFIAMTVPKAEENKIKFTCSVQDGIPERILSDPVRLKQILTNVVGNAIKFTPNGRVDLIVSARDKQLEFRVKDTGVGISMDQAKKLFQPFMQADPSTTRRFGGTGLGLVLTKKLCQAMGGDFILESSLPDLGSTFMAHVKIQEPKESENTGLAGPIKSSPKIASALPLQGSKILLVEDSMDNQLLIRILLEKAGAQVEVADNGIKGVQKALNEDYALVLMDVQMPEMDGIDATRELRKKGFIKPIIALTAHAMKEEKDRCLKSGFDDFLTKPIQKERLISVLKANINKWRNYEGTLGIEIQ